jgi:hypothetical protein
MENIRIVAREFREWLARHDPHAKVGWACTPRTCPLANFIADRWKVGPVDVEHYGIRIAVLYNAAIVGWRDRRIPDWATDFIEHVDEEIQEEVSAGQALRILDTVTGGRIGEDGDPDERQGDLLNG